MHRPDKLPVFGIALLAVATVLLFFGGPDYDAARSVVQFWNNGHILYFGLLTGLALRLPALRDGSTLRLWLTVIGVTLLAGTAIELIQHYTGRSAQYGDLLRDLAGCLLVLAFAPGARERLHGTWRRATRVAVPVFGLYLLLPLAVSVVDEIVALRQFPVLADFETPFELERWGQHPGLSVTPAPGERSGHSLLLPLTTARYSGAGLRHIPGDWRGYNRLLMDFYNPDGGVLRLTCRISDLAHDRGDALYADRYNRDFSLQPGWNTISIDLHEVARAPATRSMDMGRIRGIGCHARSLPEPRRLYVDDIRLAR